MFRWVKTSKGEVAYVNVKDVTVEPAILDRLETLYIDNNKTLAEISKTVQMPQTKVRDSLLSIGLEVGMFCKEGLTHSYEIEDREDALFSYVKRSDCTPHGGSENQKRRSPKSPSKDSP